MPIQIISQSRHHEDEIYNAQGKGQQQIDQVEIGLLLGDHTEVPLCDIGRIVCGANWLTQCG
jgi:hypothetical protein